MRQEICDFLSVKEPPASSQEREIVFVQRVRQKFQLRDCLELPFTVAYRREKVHLQLLWLALPNGKHFEEASAHAHQRQTLSLFLLRQEIFVAG
jgi:hypothetical protein